MKTFILNNKLLVVSLIIIVLTNLWIITSIEMSRSSTDHQVILSFRELRPNYSYRSDNSGMSVRLKWQSDYLYNDSPILSEEKLIQLGFLPNVFDLTSRKFYTDTYPTEQDVWFLFEVDGPLFEDKVLKSKEKLAVFIDSTATSEWIDYDNITIEQFKEQLEKVDTNHISKSLKQKIKSRWQQFHRLSHEDSRLMVKDAFSLNETNLPQLSKNEFLAKGKVKLNFRNQDGETKIAGRLSELYTDTYHVPSGYMDQLKETKSHTYRPRLSRYNKEQYFMQVQFDSQNRPRISSVQIRMKEKN